MGGRYIHHAAKKIKKTMFKLIVTAVYADETLF